MDAARIHDILVFLSVVETGSFVAGGRAMGLTRSTAGKAVARLEDGYGLRLLNRTTRAVSLTDEGRGLYEHGVAIRAAVESAEMSLAGERGMPRGLLRITAPDAIGRRLILPVLAPLLQRWPDLRVEASFSDRVERMVDEGFDLALRFGVSAPAQGLVTRTLLTDAPVLCALPGYLERRGRPASAEQLWRHDLLQFASRGARQIWRLRDADGTWVPASGRTRLWFDSAEALREAALAGLGIAMLPELVVGPDLAAGRLERVLAEVDCDRVPVLVLYPHRRHLEPRVRVFIDALVAHVRRSEP